MIRTGCKEVQKSPLGMHSVSGGLGFMPAITRAWCPVPSMRALLPPGRDSGLRGHRQGAHSLCPQRGSAAPPSSCPHPLPRHLSPQRRPRPGSSRSAEVGGPSSSAAAPVKRRAVPASTGEVAQAGCVPQLKGVVPLKVTFST